MWGGRVIVPINISAGHCTNSGGSAGHPATVGAGVTERSVSHGKLKAVFLVDAGEEHVGPVSVGSKLHARPTLDGQRCRAIARKVPFVAASEAGDVLFGTAGTRRRQ